MARRKTYKSVHESYYDAPALISRGCHLNLIITMRSRGKTYGFIKAAIKDWLRDGSQFVLVRRYDTELQQQFPTMFDAMTAHEEFPQLVFKTAGNRGYVAYRDSNTGTEENPKYDWHVIAYGIPLSKQANYKGTEFARVKKIIFDEFIRVLHTPPGYLRDDVGAFLDLFKTISRDRENVYAYLLGNSCDLTNPYFRFIGLNKEPPEGFSYYNHKNVLVHYEKNAAFREEEARTVVGRIVDGTPWGGVMLDNEFYNGGDIFIETKTKNAKFRYAIEYCDISFGVWMDPATLVYYVNTKIPSDATQRFALTTEDMQPSRTMIGAASPLLKQLIKIYRIGGLRFESAACREYFVDALKYCGLR